MFGISFDFLPTWSYGFLISFISLYLYLFIAESIPEGEKKIFLSMSYKIWTWILTTMIIMTMLI